MKIILNIIAFTLISLWSYAQSNAVEKYFSAYENDANFSVVTISPKMFGMIANATKGNKDEVLELVRDIKGLKIISTDKEGMKYYNEATKKLPTNEYEVLMTVKDKNQNIKFLTKGSGDIVSELLLLIGGADNFTLMSFVGNLDLNKISKLANKLDLEGSEHLDKLKNKK